LGFSVQDSELGIRKRIIVKTDGRILFLNSESIRWFEAEGNYVRIYAEEPLLIRSSISAVEKELDATVFLRISRSIIINMNYVREMKPWFRGNYRVWMIDGTELTLTNGYRDRLNEFIGIHVGRRSKLAEG
jgi:two-component system, LytTR family, response regulator